MNNFVVSETSPSWNLFLKTTTLLRDLSQNFNLTRVMNGWMKTPKAFTSSFHPHLIVFLKAYTQASSVYVFTMLQCMIKVTIVISSKEERNKLEDISRDMSFHNSGNFNMNAALLSLFSCLLLHLYPNRYSFP